MSSLPQQMELQHQDSMLESLLDSSYNNPLEDSSLEISNPETKKFQNKAKYEMEERAEKQQQQSQSTILQRILDLYNEGMMGVEKQMNLLYQLPILKPKQIILWKLVINMLTLFVFFEIPVYIAYGPPFWKTLNSDGKIAGLYYTIALLLVLDMGLDFITAYYKHGNLITDSRKIAFHYLYGNFPFDLIALIISIARLSLFTSEYRFIFLMFYFKLPSMLRFDAQLNEMVLLLKRTRLLYEVGKKIIFMLFCFNVFCCVFYMLGIYSVQSNYNSWLTTSGNFGTIIDRPPHEIYFFSFYFSLGTVSTTMGYGDITPMNIIECSWSLLGVMFAIIVFANNINYFQKMMEEYNLNDFKQFKYKISINKFMESKDVPQELQERVRQYLNEYWHQQGTRDQEQEQLVFQMLAPELKQELYYQSYGQFLQYTFFSKYFSKQFLKDLADKIVEVNYSTGDIIIQAGDSNDDQSFYFIQRGSIALKSGNIDIVKRKLLKGESFGELSFLTGLPRSATAYSKEYSQLHKLSRSDFLEVLSQYPDDYEIYCHLKDGLLFSKNFSAIGQFCWTCKKFDHFADKCPYTHYIAKVQQLIQSDTVLDQNQQRMKIQRYDRKHWPTRTNQKTLVNGLNNQKLKKYANVMLKTIRSKKNQQFSPMKRQESKKISIDNNLNLEAVSKTASVSDDLMKSLKVNDSQEQQKDQKQQQGEQEQLKSLQKKLNEYRDISEFSIHKGLDQFDEPSNFKYYLKRGNYSNFKVFDGIQEAQKKQQIKYRTTYLKPH